jgi:hypothetical protein
MKSRGSSGAANAARVVPENLMIDIIDLADVVLGAPKYQTSHIADDGWRRELAQTPTHRSRHRPSVGSKSLRNSTI